MKEGLKRAVEILDVIQKTVQDKLLDAYGTGDESAITRWQAHAAALTLAAHEIEQEIT